MKKTMKLLCALLLAAMLLTLSGCAQKDAAPAAAQQAASLPGGDVGKGQTAFPFTVVDKEGKETNFTVHTDKETVGDALLAAGLIEGETSQYGLYVKSVNGIAADYDKDQTWWGFYIDGVSASAGVDSTDSVNGSTYGFKVEK